MRDTLSDAVDQSWSDFAVNAQAWLDAGGSPKLLAAWVNQKLAQLSPAMGKAIERGEGQNRQRRVSLRERTVAEADVGN